MFFEKTTHEFEEQECVPVSKIMHNILEFEVYGDLALFSDPVTRGSGEKASYPVPTYEALKGITKAIYYKPTLTFYIDECRIMNPIHTEAIAIKTKNYKKTGGDMFYYRYLKDVRYQVRAHFEFNPNHTELMNDWNEQKHIAMLERSLAVGGRRSPHLGCKECQAYVRPCSFGEGVGAYDGVNKDLGIMYHGITYPDEAYSEDTKGCMTVRLWHASMEDGILHFPRPEDCIVRLQKPCDEPIHRFERKEVV